MRVQRGWRTWCARDFDELVVIPARIVDCFLVDGDWGACQRRALEFIAAHAGGKAMFEMTPHLCHRDYRTGYIFDTGDFLRERYWRLILLLLVLPA